MISLIEILYPSFQLTTLVGFSLENSQELHGPGLFTTYQSSNLVCVLEHAQAVVKR